MSLFRSEAKFCFWRITGWPLTTLLHSPATVALHIGVGVST